MSIDMQKVKKSSRSPEEVCRHVAEIHYGTHRLFEHKKYGGYVVRFGIAQKNYLLGGYFKPSKTTRRRALMKKNEFSCFELLISILTLGKAEPSN